MSDPCCIVPDHGLRHRLNLELHMRRFPDVRPPFRLLHLLIVPDDGSASNEGSRLTETAAILGADVEVLTDRCSLVVDQQICLRWEQHTEFSTYTFIDRHPAASLFDADAWQETLGRWRLAMRGDVLRGLQLSCLAESQAEPDDAALAGTFSPGSLISSDLAGRRARV